MAEKKDLAQQVYLGSDLAKSVQDDGLTDIIKKIGEGMIEFMPTYKF